MHLFAFLNRKMGEQRDPSTFLHPENHDLQSPSKSIRDQSITSPFTQRARKTLSIRKMSEKTSWLVRSFSTTKFHIPFLLMFTYLALTVIPSITRSIRYLLGYKSHPYEWTFFYLCSVRLSYTVDGVIYVFLQRRVRRWLWNKLTACCVRRDGGNGNGSFTSTRSAMFYR